MASKQHRWTVILFLIISSSSAWATDFFAGMRVSSPLVLSGSVGIRGGSYGDGLYQPSVELEAGIGGGRILAGLDNLGDGFGAGVKAVYMRTWGEPIDVDEDQQYIGALLLLGYDRFTAELGGYRLVEGDEDDEWLSTFGIGFRL